MRTWYGLMAFSLKYVEAKSSRRQGSLIEDQNPGPHPYSASQITCSSEKNVAPVKEARTRAMIHMGASPLMGLNHLSACRSEERRQRLTARRENTCVCA